MEAPHSFQDEMVWNTGFCLPIRSTSCTFHLLPWTPLPWTTCFLKAPCPFIPRCLCYAIAFAWKALLFFHSLIWILPTSLSLIHFLALALLVNSLITEDCTGLYPPFPSVSLQQRCAEESSSKSFFSLSIGRDPWEKGFVWFISVYLRSLSECSESVFWIHAKDETTHVQTGWVRKWHSHGQNLHIPDSRSLALSLAPACLMEYYLRLCSGA